VIFFCSSSPHEKREKRVKRGWTWSIRSGKEEIRKKGQFSSSDLAGEKGGENAPVPFYFLRKRRAYPIYSGKKEEGKSREKFLPFRE